MIVIKLNASKIDKDHMFEGKAGKYVDLCLMENRDGPDQYGNDGFVVQGVSKESRAAGERGPIVGNWRNIHTSNQGPARTPVTKQGKVTGPASNKPTDDSEVPF